MNIFGQSLSERIVDSLNGNNLCKNLPYIGNKMGAAVDYTLYNGHGGLLITNQDGASFIILSAPNDAQPVDVNCARPANSFLQAIGLEPAPLSPNTNLGIGSMRKFRMA